MSETVLLPDETAEESEFRAKARAWLEANAPRRRERGTDDLEGEGELALLSDRDEGDAVAKAKEFQAKLAEGGFAGLTWPKEYGGQGMTTRHSMIWAQEASAYEIPAGIFTI